MLIQMLQIHLLMGLIHLFHANLFPYVLCTCAYYVHSCFSIVRVRDKQHDGLETAPKKNVAGQYRKRKWEKPSGFIGRKNDDVFTEDGDRSKMIKRAAISSSKRSSTTDGFGDSRRADFSRHDAPGKAQQRGNKSGNKHQKERFGKPVKASKFYHKSSR